MQAHASIPDPGPPSLGPSSSHCSPLLQSLPRLPLGSGALQVSPPDGSRSTSLGRSPLLIYLCLPIPQVWELQFSQEHSSSRFVCIITFRQCHGKELFIFPAYSYCFSGPKAFRILLCPTWTQTPLGILADAKKRFRGIRCYRAKNWEMWNGGERAQ